MISSALVAVVAAIIVVGIVGLIANFLRSRAAGSSKPIIRGVQSIDNEMNTAIAEARRTSPEFISALRAAGDRAKMFSVKMRALTSAGGYEHFWIRDLTYRDGVFRGVVSDALADVPTLKEGDAAQVAADELSDWMYLEGTGPEMAIVGGYTLRVLRDRATPQERAGYWAHVRFKEE